MKRRMRVAQGEHGENRNVRTEIRQSPRHILRSRRQLLSVVMDGVDLVAGGVPTSRSWPATGRRVPSAAASPAASPIAHHHRRYRIQADAEHGRSPAHGGPDNFAVRRWTAEQTGDSIRFSLTSPDGDQGYPGTVETTATYRLSRQCAAPRSRGADHEADGRQHDEPCLLEPVGRTRATPSRMR